MTSNPVNPEYSFSQDKITRQVAPDQAKLAKEIDKNGDQFLTDKEIKDYISQDKVDILRDPKKFHVDEQAVMNEFKSSLQNKIPESVKSYHTYQDFVSDMQSLAGKYPDQAKLVSLGKSFEGRDVWALKVSNGAQGDTSGKPGVVITGDTHAREWAGGEIVLNLAHQLLDSNDPQMKKRLNGVEAWLVPVANPDGFSYTQTHDNMWRKNRRPIEQTACDLNPKPPHVPTRAEAETDAVKGTGVDLNRNYYDGDPKHFYLYRPAGDTPCSTWDDFSATSDDPNSDTYRGPAGASEKEIQALLNLELNHANIRGCMDFHSYGQMILYPWGHDHTQVPEMGTYVDLGNKMKSVMKGQYDVMQSADLYPASGSSEDCHYVNHRMSYTLEVGQSFQPGEKELKQVVADGTAACLVYLDHFLG